MTKKILFIVAHRLDRSPGQRFRFEQYLDYLSQNGFEFIISNFLNEHDDKIFYSKGKYVQKFWILIKALWQRYNDVRRASEFDIVFIYRDAIMIGSTWFERRFHKSKAKVIYDFDDAIWFPETSDGNVNLQWLKRPSKVIDIFKLSDMVFAGNSFLADFAKKYNNNVKIVPTTIDINYYVKAESTKHYAQSIKHEALSTEYNVQNNKHEARSTEYNVQNTKHEELSTKHCICIGWTGTSTTIKHFQLAIPVLNRIKEKYKDSVYFKIISDVPYNGDDIKVENCKWSKDSEIKELSSFDIGIMPLPFNEWSKGKCGFKGLQYMALEIPAVMSAVGVNVDIVNHGVNGFLVYKDDDWFDILSSLIESKELRDKIGKEGRKTVINNYSCQALNNTYVGYFNEILDL